MDVIAHTFLQMKCGLALTRNAPGPKYSPPSELMTKLREPLDEDGTEVVVLAKVLADDINFGCVST